MQSKRATYLYPATIIKKRGVKNLAAQPRITIGTIHSVKGGTTDHVILFPDLSPQAAREMHVNPSALIRLFYVALTRARRSVSIAQPGSNLKVSLDKVGAI